MNNYTPSKEILHEAIGALAELRDAATGIKEELEGIKEELEGILSGRPRVVLESPRPVVSEPLSVVPNELDTIKVRHSNLLAGLKYLRAALDSQTVMGSEDIKRLHKAEALLSAELGEPIWEGRRS